MRYALPTLALLATICFGSAFVQAEGTTAAKPSCEKGKQLLSEDFSGSTLDKGWTVAKGKWEVSDGVLKGVEKPEDMHPAVIGHAIEAHNLIAEFSFRFDGSKSVAFSLNNKKGHVCRVSITPALVSLNKDKPGKDSTEKGAMLGKEKVSLEPGTWHTMIVTVCGKQMAANLDGKDLVSGSNDGIDVEKTSIRFPTSGTGVSIKQVRVWEAVPQKTASK
ncbi:MAG TPA: family 16 glycoside hydrolase [Tepidisphaeraceae bacterium]|jgi:hypothetical protein|nr:family 16 glycoside hydrolase [Tepidisphaeraceae bacterium]